ncbi:MAG TPA: HupE/UreJ family protein [Gemmatimonadaceae bacterium]|nr:HupE/UreJ family protein [Gemmatimonadaceae bacterium]
MTRGRVLLPVLALLTLAQAICIAHEMGSTRVAIWISDDRYRVEIVTDAQALADKLAAASREAPGAALGAPEERRFGERLHGRMTLSFDGVPVHPAVSYAVSPATRDMASVVTIELTGPLPEGAQTLQWTYGWTYASYSLTVQRPNQVQPSVTWLSGGESSAPVVLGGPAPVDSRFQVATRYLRLGFTHIVPYGFDHVLFVLGIFLLTRQLRPLLVQVTAFTVAHSLTLALSIFGVVALAPAVVEPLIALSIAYVAIENLLVRTVKPWRVVVVFAFGLLHGLGFAGALQERGLPRSEFVTALVTFNLGVEAGQLGVIGTAFLLVGLWFGNRPWYRRRIVMPASALIACIGVFWTVDRLARSRGP